MDPEIGALIAVTELVQSGFGTLCRKARGFGNRPVLQGALRLDSGRQSKLMLDHSCHRCGTWRLERRRKATAQKRDFLAFPVEVGFNRFHGSTRRAKRSP